MSSDPDEELRKAAEEARKKIKTDPAALNKILGRTKQEKKTGDKRGDKKDDKDKRKGK